jgi:hypothetical protein
MSIQVNRTRDRRIGILLIFLSITFTVAVGMWLGHYIATGGH